MFDKSRYVSLGEHISLLLNRICTQFIRRRHTINHIISIDYVSCQKDKTRELYYRDRKLINISDPPFLNKTFSVIPQHVPTDLDNNLYDLDHRIYSRMSKNIENRCNFIIFYVIFSCVSTCKNNI